MSLSSFQSALAYVIRSYHAEHETCIEDLFQRFDLTNDEKIILTHVIQQQGLKSYSEELFLARWTIIREALKFLQPFVDMKALSDLWERDFEPKSETITHEDLVLKFVEYLVFDKEGSAFIQARTPAFFPDFMRYLHAVFTFKHNYLPKVSLPPQSVLTERYFFVLKLDYDVRDFFAQLVELEDFSNMKLAIPPQQNLSILFIATDEVTEFRSFEIDHELANSLADELKGEEGKLATLSSYEDLVDIGLCKPRGTRRPCCSKIH